MDSKRANRRGASAKKIEKKNAINIGFLGNQGQMRNLNIQIAENSRFQLETPYFPVDGQFLLRNKVHMKNVVCSLESEELKRFINTDELNLHLDTYAPTFFNKHQIWKFDVELKGRIQFNFEEIYKRIWTFLMPKSSGKNWIFRPKLTKPTVQLFIIQWLTT